jgi:HSP20 family molecular chaperone IbpA
MNTQIEKNGSGAKAERFEQRPVIPPPVDIYESKDEILVVTDVPGVATDGITVRLEKNELHLHARRSPEGKGDATGGRRVADYARTFLVPRSVDPEKIEASLKDGVLTIRLPKSEASKPRQISVRAA